MNWSQDLSDTTEDLEKRTFQRNLRVEFMIAFALNLGMQKKRRRMVVVMIMVVIRLFFKGLSWTVISTGEMQNLHVVAVRL